MMNKKPICQQLFVFSGDLVELPFRIMFFLKQKIIGYVFPTIHMQRDVNSNEVNIMNKKSTKPNLKNRAEQ
jgi:hypothetical protein